MTVQTTDESVIEKWLNERHPFVIYRMPDETCCHGVRQLTNTLTRLEHISELNHHKGFIFVPFHPGKEHSLWIISPEEEVSFTPVLPEENIPPAPIPVPFCGTPEPQPSAAYAACFAKCIDALKRHEFDKLVLSRYQTIEIPSGFSLASAFRAACRRYIHSYVYLLYTPENGFWLGATPEILLSGRQGHYKTVALAGTQALDNGQLSEPWSEKNVHEQQYVTDYIVDCLQKQDIHPHLKGPFTVTAGSLAHLKTELTFTLPPHAESISHLLQSLHPTPAVCGLPKDKAYRFLRENEQYDRGYYSGLLGYLDAEGQTDLYVNLRCMQITDSHIRCFAGGGLLSSSILEDEWTETEKKLQTMKYVIQKGTAHVL